MLSELAHLLLKGSGGARVQLIGDLVSRPQNIIENWCPWPSDNR